MVALMEKAALRAVEGYLAPAEIAVGSMVQVRHFRATPPGMEVVATAKLVEVCGTRLLFEVEAFNEKEKIGGGLHERIVVPAGEFVAKSASKAEFTQPKIGKPGS
jgi:predicted thioesterase